MSEMCDCCEDKSVCVVTINIEGGQRPGKSPPLRLCQFCLEVLLKTTLSLPEVSYRLKGLLRATQELGARHEAQA